MSGGRFDYLQFRFGDIVHDIAYDIKHNFKLDEDKDMFGTESEKYKPITIGEFQKAIEYLKMAQIYAHRVDWLVSGDDGERSFHERLQDELDKETNRFYEHKKVYHGINIPDEVLHTLIDRFDNSGMMYYTVFEELTEENPNWNETLEFDDDGKLINYKSDDVMSNWLYEHGANINETVLILYDQ